MRAMTAFVDHTLIWSKPKFFAPRYALRFGDELVATLCFQNFFSSAATAESGDGSWTFERVGFLKKRTVIHANGSSTTLGIFRKNTWKKGGCLELSDGRKFTVIANLWKNTVEFKTEIGEPCFHLKSHGVFRLSATVQMYRKCLHVPEFPWFVILGLYLLIMMKKDAASHVVHG